MEHRRVLRALAAYGLPTVASDLPDRRLSDRDWRVVRDGIRHQRLAGQAVQAADQGAWCLSQAQRDQLEDDHVTAMAHVLTLERDLLRVHDVLSTARVPVLVLKGSGVAHLDYADPALRAFGDNDVLLPSDRFAEALGLLLDAGYTRPAPELRAGFDVRFGKGATLLGAGVELDVHRTLAMGPFGFLVDLDELWDRPAGFELGGRELGALGTEQRYLHACFHAVIGNAGNRLLPHRDVAEMFLFGSYDLDRLRTLAASWSAEVVLARAIVDTWDVLGLAQESSLVEWARDRVPTRRDERLLGVYGAGASYAAKTLAGLSVVPGWRDRIAYARMVALPGDQSLESRGRSRRQWLWHGTKRLVRDLRRRRARESAGPRGR